MDVATLMLQLLVRRCRSFDILFEVLSWDGEGWYEQEALLRDYMLIWEIE